MEVILYSVYFGVEILVHPGLVFLMALEIFSDGLNVLLQIDTFDLCNSVEAV